jgi:RNA-binding protein 8A
MEAEERYSGRAGQFESVENEGGKGPAKSVEGWIVFVHGINAESNEEGGSSSNLHMTVIKCLSCRLDYRISAVCQMLLMLRS